MLDSAMPSGYLVAISTKIRIYRGPVNKDRSRGPTMSTKTPTRGLADSLVMPIGALDVAAGDVIWYS